MVYCNGRAVYVVCGHMGVCPNERAATEPDDGMSTGSKFTRALITLAAFRVCGRRFPMEARGPIVLCCLLLFSI